MSYAKVLDQLITESGLQVKEIAQKCEEMGVQVTPAYISSVRTSKKGTPSDRLSRAIALICGVDENTLVVEAYYENAPEEFRQMIDVLREDILVPIFDTMLPTEGVAVVEATKQTLRDLPIAQFVKMTAETLKAESKKILDIFTVESSFENDDGSKTVVQMKAPEGIAVADDGMAPNIPAYTTVICELKEQGEYRNGDILCYRRVGELSAKVRTAAFMDDERKKVMMLPLNKSFEPETLDWDSIIVFGKVERIVLGL